MLTTISASDFELQPPERRVIFHDFARRFAILQLPKAAHSVALSWRSTLIEPVVQHDEKGRTWIGVDERVVCVMADGMICFSLGLGSPLLDIKCFPEFVVVLCQADMLAINLDCSLRQLCDLSDVPDSVGLIDGRLVVGFADGHTQAF